MVRHAFPVATRARATVLLFHDHGILPRGWHHITRYTALGYEVYELENRSSDVDLAQGIADGRALAEFVAHQETGLPVIAFGEGFGGTIALAVASEFDLAKAAAINPVVGSELLEDDPAIECPVLLGICRMDEVSSPEAQDELASRIADLKRIDYPKYGHERVNAFENALLSFMHL